MANPKRKAKPVRSQVKAKQPKATPRDELEALWSDLLRAEKDRTRAFNRQVDRIASLLNRLNVEGTQFNKH